MKEASFNHVYERLGIKISRHQRLAYLRFCSTCVVEDRAQWGETYWHRVHQISGVEVCPRHSIFLENSDTPRRHINNQSKFISAEASVRVTSTRPLEISNIHHSIILKLAKEAAWLLNWRGEAPSLNVLQKRYYNLLLERGYAYYSGHVRTSKLLKDFTDFYSADFLAGLQRLKTKRLLQVTLEHKSTVAQHPLRHLLLIVFLGLTTEQVFTTFEENKPFGDGPWPCLNRPSEHFRKPLAKCRIVSCYVKGKHYRPKGIFTCSCGFIYTRRGPDLTEDDRFRRDTIENYGEAWETALRKYWLDTSIPIPEAARRLGVFYCTMRRHAIRLGISSARPSPKTRKANVKPAAKRYGIIRPPISDGLEPQRARWLEVLKHNAGSSRTTLMQQARSLYKWLRKNDEEWLTFHLPAPLKRGGTGLYVDWERIDPELSAAVTAAATRVKSKTGYPVRASITAIIREVGHKPWIESRLNRLPLTAKALSECIETLECYCLRKVKWAEIYYHQQNTCPTRNQFVKFANLTNNKSVPAEGRPIRVSQAEIIRSVGHKADLEQRLHKLPQAARALSIHLESLEAFSIGNVEWAESCFFQEGYKPTRLQLMVRAVVRNKTGMSPSVQYAIDAAMERLNRYFP
jgi:hypothetical protein